MDMWLALTTIAISLGGSASLVAYHLSNRPLCTRKHADEIVYLPAPTSDSSTGKDRP